MNAPPEQPDFLSGHSGHVAGVRLTSKAIASDLLADGRAATRLQRPRLRRAARSMPRRRVLVLAVERTDIANLLAGAREELLRSRHQVRLESTPVGGRGKFENLNALLREHPPREDDWLIVVDDDVVLPRGFLDMFLFLAERFEFRLAQPAHRSRSHAAWAVTRRHAGSVARETSFVEIGPVTAFHRDTFEVLLPFPELRIGWGLDAHWSALAREHGWRIGVVDATSVRHSLRPVASSYEHQAAIDEARGFLTNRPYVSAGEAQRTLVEHRSWQ
jgi:Glycosyltransferase like family 2